MPTPHKTRYFFSATIKVLKANSGMLLSCLVVPLLVLLAYGDQMGGTTLSACTISPSSSSNWRACGSW